MELFSEESPLTIVLADDHEVVRAGLRRLLSVDKRIKILDEAKNGKDAVELIKYHNPNIGLLDILMPVKNGIEAVEELKSLHVESSLVMLTAFEDSKHLEKAIAAGADGYLTKDIGAKELINALMTVITGERVFSKSIIKIMQNKFSPNTDNENETVSITKREQEILNLVALGKTSPQISEKLHISVRTVESHRYNLMKKLGISNAAGLVRYAVMNSGMFDDN